MSAPEITPEMLINEMLMISRDEQVRSKGHVRRRWEEMLKKLEQLEKLLKVQ